MIYFQTPNPSADGGLRHILQKGYEKLKILRLKAPIWGLGVIFKTYY